MHPSACKLPGRQAVCHSGQLSVVTSTRHCKVHSRVRPYLPQTAQQVHSRCEVIAASALSSADPDDYEMDCDEPNLDVARGTLLEEQDEAETSGRQEEASEGWRNAAGGVGRIHRSLLLAFTSLKRAPLEVWNCVGATTGAAVELIVSPAEGAVQGRAKSVQEGPGGISPVSRARERWEEATTEMPKGTWGKIQWLWDQPPVKRLRITISMAQWSVRLPAIMALLATQMGLLASQVSLPMLAPLLLGTGMMLRSIRSNASIIFPRLCVMVVLLWMLWFANSVVQNTVFYLRRQGALDSRLSGAVVTASECCSLLAALVIVLSMIGVNVSALLLPAGIALAYAAKDLSHNFLAGFFLFAVQPFKLGDRVAVSYSSPAAASSATRSAWFEGTCEKVDLRYTVVKNGSRRLFVPNSAFLTREFMVVDDVDSPKSPNKRDLGTSEEDERFPGPPSHQQPPYVPFPASQRPVWAQGGQQQMMQNWGRSSPGPLEDTSRPTGLVEQEQLSPSHRHSMGQGSGAQHSAEKVSRAPDPQAQYSSNVTEWGQSRSRPGRVRSDQREGRSARDSTPEGDMQRSI